MKTISTCIFLMLMVSCTTSSLRPENYLKWVRNYQNGLHIKNQIEDYVFDVQYIPVAFRLLRYEKQLSKDKLIKKEKALNQIVSFELNLGIEDDKTDLVKFNAPTKTEYQQRAYYFSFAFQRDIFLEQEGKKIPCTMFHFERLYSLKNNRNFMLGFEGVDKSKPFRLLIESEELKTGVVKMEFSENEIPDLRI